jgi:hypothetical protein
MPPQGSLYFGRCNVNDLHRAAVASSGDGVTTWAELDAADTATVLQGPSLLIVLRVEDYHAVAGIVQAGCKFGPVRRVGHTPYCAVAPQGAQKCLPRLCAEEVYAPTKITRRDDVAGGPV